ncbi:radical SAM protein [bacterium]|nr:radical SAM protein [bacterium]
MMDITQSTKRYAATEAARVLPRLLARSSDANLIRLTRVLEGIALQEVHKVQMRQLRGLFQQKHPALTLGRRVLREINPKCRRKLVENLGLNAIYFGAERRDELMANDQAAPFLLVISPTERCNLHCRGCWAAKYRKDSDMPLELLDRIITEAKEMGIYFFTITGGEPFIRKDLFDIYAKHNDVYFQVYTNGTLINDSIARKLAELGNVVPAISIEGFEEQTDDRRGRGTFAQLMEAMDTLRRKQVPFGFSSMTARKNVDVVASDEFVDMLIEKGCLFGWYFTYVPIGMNPDPSQMLTPAERECQRERVQHIRATKPIFVADFWNDGWTTNGCMAARLYAHINSNGDVEPCAFVHFAVDNIKEKSLSEGLNSSFFQAIRNRYPWTDNQLKPCMFLDNPHVLREAVAESGAYATHEGAESLITELAPTLDRYAEEMEHLTDPMWEKLQGQLRVPGRLPEDKTMVSRGE